MKQRDDGVAVASAGPYAHHLHVAPYHSIFYRLDVLPDAQVDTVGSIGWAAQPTVSK